MRKSQKQIDDEHEAFKNRLVEEVLGSDASDKVPMEKVVMLIWQFRTDPSVVTFMARFVAKYAGSRDVFDGIEFYLPQLAHMIIHLEVEWDDAILERFALVVAQQSIHFALQLNWILQGALQDYQPENEDGTPNPNYNPVFYSRCLTLLRNVERCVVYGKPRAQALQRLYEQGQITKSELLILEHADRRFNALQITAQDADERNAVDILDGWLFVQNPYNGDDQNGSYEWAHRYCYLEKHVLNCYYTKGCSSDLKLERAMSLERAVVTRAPGNAIRVKTPRYEFALKCASEEEQTLWKRRLSEESSCGSALFQSKDNKLREDMTPAQLDRYEFFQNERDFVYALTELAEDLRFLDRAERKNTAPGKMSNLKIPPHVYLPLCNSSDIWRRVCKPLPKETRVFNTKERCPVIMHFVTQRGEQRKKGPPLHPNLDVAEYLHMYFDITPDLENLQEEEEDGEEDELGGVEDNIKGSEHGSLKSGVVWNEDDEDHPHAAPVSSSPEKNVRGNTRVQRLLRESVVTLPTLLSKRLKPHKTDSRRRISVMDRQTEMQPLVPILEGNRTVYGDGAETGSDTGSVVSVEKSSMLIKDTIVLGHLDEGDIDMESIDRAKHFISGGESWAEKSANMLESARKESEDRGETVQIEIASCMAKSNDDLRQEVFVMQMIHFYKSVFAQAKLPLWLKTYRILSTSSNTGLLEVLVDATSLDGLKKSVGYPEQQGGLREYFEIVYGGPNSPSFKAAQTNFMQSLAAYSIVSYLLGLKDRHNGNIMIDTRGHVIFIDFGFALGMKPGHEASFERAPFKFTKEYVQVMDGVGSECYKEFERLFVEGFIEARKNSQIALGLVEIMMYKSNYPCFSGWRYGNGKALRSFEKRLMLRMPEQTAKRRALRLVRKARGHFGTYLYDVFQKATNGYAI